MEKRHLRNRKNIKGVNKVFRKHTLESLDPLLQLNWRRTKKESTIRMPTGTFRFYEELNNFLPDNRKKVDFEAEFNGRQSIKEIIEECGVPPTKVDLVLINGKSVDFNTIFQDGDRVSVYPVFGSFNIQNVTLLRKFPLR